MAAKEDDFDDDELEDDTIVERKEDGLKGETIAVSKDREVGGNRIVERNDKDCYTVISPKPHPDLKIEPLEVSMVYSVFHQQLNRHTKKHKHHPGKGQGF